MTTQEALLELVRLSPLVPDEDRASLAENITSGTLSDADQKSIAVLLALAATDETHNKEAA